MKDLIYQKQLINKFYFFTMLVGIVFFSNYLLSCKGTTEPEKLIPSRRDYIWSEDTLDIKLPNMLTYRHIVGNSPDNIWVGTLDASYDMSLWHYDGNKWETVFFPGYATSALWLFDDGTLWAGTKESKIWKRENDEWTESYNLKLDGYDRINIFDFYADTKSNIYAVGLAVNLLKNDYKAIIFHYNGVKWSLENIPNVKGAFHQIEYDKYSKLYFLWGNGDEEENFIERIYTFDTINIQKLTESDFGFGLSSILGKVYINTNRKIYKYVDSSLKLWKDFSGTDFLSNFVGRSENDFFNNSSKGIGHYNGIDYKTIYETHLDLQSKIIIDKEIFVVANDFENRKYIIIHGKLKE